MKNITKRSDFLVKQFIKVNAREFYWRIYGRSIQNPEMPNEPGSFLFICKGNICRSPFAEHLAKSMAEKKNIVNKEFYSAGLEVSHSMPSPNEAVLAAEHFGVGLRDHKSRGIDNGVGDLYDMIIVMDMPQFNYLRKSFPQFRNKIFLLPLFEKNIIIKERYLLYNILDPYGRSIEEFLTCYQRIERCIDNLLTEIGKAKGKFA